MSGSRIWIDGQEVGVEVDNNVNPFAAALPLVEMDGVQKKPWWRRLLGLLGWRSK
jgi:hypothetical protein